MYLDTTTRKLELLLGGAVSANEVEFIASYADIVQADQTLSDEITNTGVSSGATPVDVVTAPASGDRRKITYLSVYNADTAAVTLTVRMDDNGTPYRAYPVTLQSGETAIFTDRDGWKVYATDGGIRTAFPSVLGASSGGTGLSSVSEGDLLVGASPSGGAWSALAIGTANYILVADGSTLAWSANLPWATLPTGSGTWTGTPTISGDLAVADGSGLIVGAATQQVVANPGSGGSALTPEFQVLGTAAADSTGVFARYAASTSAPGFVLAKSRGATVGSFTAVAANDVLGFFAFAGSDGTDLNTIGARISAIVSGTVAGSKIPTDLRFSTAAGASADDLTERMRLTQAGLLFLGDTANANMTVGLTLNQGANDDEILALKSSDVGHGRTSVAETDTFARVAKHSATLGGLSLYGLAAEGSTTGVQVRGFVTSPDTAKTTSAIGMISIVAEQHDGANGREAVDADGNLLVIRASTAGSTVARYIFDTEGSAHADVEWTTFDHHDDLALIEGFEALMAPGQVQRRFGEAVKYDAAFFEREGLLHDVRDVGDGRMRGMFNYTRGIMATFGAIRQVGGLALDVQSHINRLESALRLMLEDPAANRNAALAALEN